LDLLAHWGFDEGTGSTASDPSGNGNNGIVSNAVWIAGIDGQALDFTGVDTQVTVADSGGLDPTDTLTIALWIAPNSWDAVPRLLQKGSGPNQYRLLARDGNLRFSLVGINLDMPAPDPGSWYHVAATYDGSLMKFYLDGQLAAQREVSVSMEPNTEPLCIGSKPGSTNEAHYFDGAIDDVRIYGRALTAAEIRNLANAFRVVTVLSPNGGTSIPGGSTYSVVWGAPTNAVSFRLNYSVDGGSNWSLIANNVTSESYAWHVPSPAATVTRGLIQVIGYDSSGGTVGTDNSDNYFTVRP
jgi:hypothetical protein